MYTPWSGNDSRLAEALLVEAWTKRFKTKIFFFFFVKRWLVTLKNQSLPESSLWNGEVCVYIYYVSSLLNKETNLTINLSFETLFYNMFFGDTFFYLTHISLREIYLKRNIDISSTILFRFARERLKKKKKTFPGWQMKRFGEWQMRTYRPPGWYKEILQGYPCMEKRRGEEEENRWVPDKWVSSRGNTHGR